MPISVSSITNLYYIDIDGDKHYVEEEIYVENIKTLFCDVSYAGGNIPYVNLNFKRHGKSFSIKMFPVEDLNDTLTRRRFGVSIEKIWELASTMFLFPDEEDIVECSELSLEITYNITVNNDTNAKIGPISSLDTHSYNEYSEPDVELSFKLTKTFPDIYWGKECYIYSIIDSSVDKSNITIEEI